LFANRQGWNDKHRRLPSSIVTGAHAHGQDDFVRSLDFWTQRKKRALRVDCRPRPDCWECHTSIFNAAYIILENSGSTYLAIIVHVYGYGVYRRIRKFPHLRQVAVSWLPLFYPRARRHQLVRQEPAGLQHQHQHQHTARSPNIMMWQWWHGNGQAMAVPHDN